MQKKSFSTVLFVHTFDGVIQTDKKVEIFFWGGEHGAAAQIASE